MRLLPLFLALLSPLLALYPNNLKNWNLDSAKAPGSTARKSVNITNIDRFTSGQSRELSHESKSNSSSCLGIQEIPDENSLQLLTPSLQERRMAKFQLDNGLKVIIISDPLLDKSGAALAVGSGSLAEPASHPGLAHFLEHMLFMGTEKYPDENVYWDFITNHGGQANAFTDNDRTVYMFSISNEAFLPALDQFSQFFISPLFAPSGVSREMHAVDQEYRRYVVSDDWRVMGLIQSLSNPENPLSRFTVGNLDTLASVTQAELKEWWKNNYSASIMTLLIYSPLPVDVLKKAVEEDFSAISSHNVTAPVVQEALQSTYTGKKILVHSIQNARALYISFDLPASYYQQVRLLEEALGDASSRSLLQILREKGLVDTIETVDGKAYDRLSLMVKITLTAKGEEQADDVLQDFFGTLSYFEEAGISQGYFDQWQKATALSYSFQSPQDVFRMLMRQGSDILDESVATFPTDTVLLSDYNPEKMKALLQLMKAKDSYIIQLSPQNITGETEKWFGAVYKVEAFPAGFVDSLGANKETSVALPESNPYLPHNLELVACEGSTLIPEKLDQEEGCQLYFLCDHQFHLPKTTAILHIKPKKEWSLGARSAVIRDLQVAAALYKLQPELFMASEAGLDIKFEEKDGAFLIKITGFSESLVPCLETIGKTFKNTVLTPLEFETVKSTLLQNYLGNLADEPFQQGIALIKETLSKSVAPYDKKAKTLEKLTFAQFESASEKMLKNLQLEGILFGNTTAAEAKALCRSLQQILQTLSFDDVYRPAYFEERKGPTLYKKEIAQLGNFAALIIQDGCFSLEKEAALSLLTRGLTEPFFTELRSKQQTGYIVKNMSPSILGTLSEILFVQSTTYDPEELLFRFELFLEGFNMDEEHFNALKASYIEELKAPEKSPLEKAEKLDKMAFLLQGDFSWYEKQIKAAEDLSFEQFKSFTQSFLARSNKQRIALLLKGQQQGLRALRYAPVSTIAALHNQGRFITFDQNKCK